MGVLDSNHPLLPTPALGIHSQAQVAKSSRSGTRRGGGRGVGRECTVLERSTWAGHILAVRAPAGLGTAPTTLSSRAGGEVKQNKTEKPKHRPGFVESLSQARCPLAGGRNLAVTPLESHVLDLSVTGPLRTWG